MFDYWGYRYIKIARNVILNYDNPYWEHDVRIAMSRVYRYFKKTLPLFRGNVKTLLKILDLEQLMSKKFLPIDSKPNICKDFNIPSKVVDEDDALEMVKAVVFNERVRLALANDGVGGLENATLTQQCIISSTNISKYCEKLGVHCKNYSCNTNLSDGKFHSFCIVSFLLDDGSIKKYLIDCTYRQFFTYQNSFLERIGLVGFPGCCMGRFMLMNESRRKTASKLLKDGYMELTPENIKNYFDGFIFEGRNGGYYAEKGKEFLDESDYDVEYSYTDYLDALDGRITLPNDWMDLLYTRLSNPEIVFDYELLDFKKHDNRQKKRINK